MLTEYPSMQPFLDANPNEAPKLRFVAIEHVRRSIAANATLQGYGALCGLLLIRNNSYFGTVPNSYTAELMSAFTGPDGSALDVMQATIAKVVKDRLEGKLPISEACSDAVRDPKSNYLLAGALVLMRERHKDHYDRVYNVVLVDGTMVLVRMNADLSVSQPVSTAPIHSIPFTLAPQTAANPEHTSYWVSRLLRALSCPKEELAAFERAGVEGGPLAGVLD